MAIRLRDIADDLNLSTMTISKVLRGQTDVSPETKARVLKRARELNYRPNISARSLRTGQTYCVGVLAQSLGDPMLAQVVRGLNDVLRGLNYGLVVSSAEGSAEGEEREAELLLSRQVDAIFLCLREDASDIPNALRDGSAPVIVIGHCPSRVSVHAVGAADVEVGWRAATHLIERRSRQIAYLRGPRTPVDDLRFSGFLRAMHEGSRTVDEEWICEIQRGAKEYSDALAAVRRMLQKVKRPDGIVAYSDVCAAAARDAALEAKLAIPKQIQIIGAGNQISVCEMSISLTTIDFGAVEIGRRAARLALRAIEKKETGPPRTINIAPSVVERNSTRTL